MSVSPSVLVAMPLCAGRHVVAPFGAVDDHAVVRVAERDSDLDLGRVRLRCRAGAEEAAPLIEDQRLARPDGALDRDRVGVRGRGGAALLGHLAPPDLVAVDDQRRRRGRRHRQRERVADAVEGAGLGRAG